MVQQETRLAIPRSDRPRHWPAASGLGHVYPHVHPRLADSQGQDTTAASLSNKVPTGSTARRVKPALTAPSSVFHPHISSEAKRGRQLPDTRYPALHQLASSNKNLRASLHFNRGKNQRCWEVSCFSPDNHPEVHFFEARVLAQGLLAGKLAVPLVQTTSLRPVWLLSFTVICVSHLLIKSPQVKHAE